MPLVVTRQVVLARSALDLQRVAVGPAVAVVAVAVPLLQELLILGLQLVLQDHAVDVCVHVVQAFGFFEVRASTSHLRIRWHWSQAPHQDSASRRRRPLLKQARRS